MMMDMNKCSEFRGKSMEEIEIGLEGVILSWLVFLLKYFILHFFKYCYFFCLGWINFHSISPYCREKTFSSTFWKRSGAGRKKNESLEDLKSSCHKFLLGSLLYFLSENNFVKRNSALRVQYQMLILANIVLSHNFVLSH